MQLLRSISTFTQASILGWLVLMPLHAQQQTEPEVKQLRPMFISQYRVRGAKTLSAQEIQDAVYRYLGPGKLPDDVDNARKALEDAYHDKGYKAVSVTIPVQSIRKGVVILEVAENPVGRLRVRGATFSSPETLKKSAPALAEGQILNFNNLVADNVAMNQLSTRTVTPSLAAGKEPGTVDVDLTVKETVPAHGSLELNNRYSKDTSPLRLNGALSYENLWQAGHTIGGSFQIAPENIKDAEVYSAYYLARVPGSEGVSVMLSGTHQNSDISTVGDLGVIGRGDTVGLRVIKTLPSTESLYQSFSFGFDYKNLYQGLDVYVDSTNPGKGVKVQSAPIHYYPVSALYTASVKNEKGRTDLNAGATWEFRGTGDDESAYSERRYNSGGGFFYFRGDLSKVRDLAKNFQWFGKIQGQKSNKPLLDSEQFSGGGLGTVRGYLESEATGDDALFISTELRTPSLFDSKDGSDKDLRGYVFLDGGMTWTQQVLAGQDDQQELSSGGIGFRGNLFEHLSGSLDIAYPFSTRPSGEPQKLMYTFRCWGEF